MSTGDRERSSGRWGTRKRNRNLERVSTGDRRSPVRRSSERSAGRRSKGDKGRRLGIRSIRNKSYVQVGEVY